VITAGAAPVPADLAGGAVTDALCPCCGELVAMRHDGGRPGVDERTSPWVFVDHRRDDERGGTVFRQPCPGSGRNEWTAGHAF